MEKIDRIKQAIRHEEEGNKRKGERVRNQLNKKLCLAHYGEYCEACGTIEDLGIDHVGGWDGKDKYRLGSSLWSWLVTHHFPSGFRTLCRDCNVLDGFLRKSQPYGVRGIDDLKKLTEGREYKKRTGEL